MCQDEFEEMSGKSRWKHHNLPLLLLTDEIDGRKKQMIALAVSSGFTFSSHLSKRCQTLKAFFSHSWMLLARGWVGVQDWTDRQHWQHRQHWTDSQQAISDETWLCNGKILLRVDSIWIRRLPMTRESKPSLFRWNEVVGNNVKANPEGSFFLKMYSHHSLFQALFHLAFSPPSSSGTYRKTPGHVAGAHRQVPDQS